MRTARWISTTATLLALAACAPAPMNRADTDSTSTCDANRMAQVEADARRTFKEVHWLHCPQAAAPAM